MFSIKTTVLQDMVNKASKCVSNNKLIPLTSLMNIKVKDNILTLTTTDATNYFYVSSPEKFDCEDFEVSILADLFIKLIQKTTANDVSFFVEGRSFVVKGNGTYNMELILDENGFPVKFPKKFVPEDSLENLSAIKLSTVNTILNYNKNSLAVSVDLPSLTYYYCGDNVVTSDQFKVCSTGIKVFDNPMLLSSRLMDILSIMSSEDISIQVCNDKNYLLFYTLTETLYAPVAEGIDTFPIDAINNLVESDFPSVCKVPRTTVLDVIDRLSLFVTPYDKKGIKLTFTKEGLMLSSKKSSGVELVPYASVVNFKDYTCQIDVELLRSQIATQDCEYLELSYGSDIAVKLTSGNIIQIVALMIDENEV